jgi:hypothetical protein
VTNQKNTIERPFLLSEQRALVAGIPISLFAFAYGFKSALREHSLGTLLGAAAFSFSWCAIALIVLMFGPRPRHQFFIVLSLSPLVFAAPSFYWALSQWFGLEDIVFIAGVLLVGWFLFSLYKAWPRGTNAPEHQR